MGISNRITEYSLRHPWRVTGIMLAGVIIILLGAALPSIQLIDAAPPWAKQISARLDFLPKVRVDTDPENMLPADEPVRVFHRDMKKRFGLNDIVVIGVVNKEDPDGVFNPSTLRKIYDLTEAAKSFQFDHKGKLIETAAPAPAAEAPEIKVEGLDLGMGEADKPEAKPAKPAGPEVAGRVIERDIIAPSTVDSMEPVGGAVSFKSLMRRPPETRAEALEIRRLAQRVPFLNGTLVSDQGEMDGKAIAIYLPITDKHLSYAVYNELKKEIAALGDGPEQFHITGLPVAEDTFGVEMFAQMAISAPLAMLVIFVLMLVFFRKLIIVISPMIVAMVSVIFTMGALVLAGYPIHILSSMIPIFIMPIAVLDSIHIISEFFEKYQLTRDRKKTLTAVMDELFSPMLYTSLTSAAGFASLALTPIPPVQVFGVFIAAGIMVAWLLTVMFIPAFVMFIPPRFLENFGSKHHASAGEDESHGRVGKALYWMGGATYKRSKGILIAALVILAVAGYGISLININDNPVKWFGSDHPIRVADRVLNDSFAGTYMAYLSMEYERSDPQAANQVFKRPDVLRWQRGLQDALAATGLVGKSNSLADIVRTVHRDLLAKSVDDPKIKDYEIIPADSKMVAECLIQFQNSNRRGDIDHFVTPDYESSSMWVQLNSGDNRDMEKVVKAAADYVKATPPPVPIKASWFGLTYINVIWQDKMVAGMMEAFAGSFLVVFLLMTLLFRSALWGLLSMIPLTVTIGAIYGVIGIVGKDYDMPVAVLSSLTLGLAVDFAIHFLARSRELHRKYGSWQATVPHVFGEPARAITRNIIVIAAGFLPLLLAPLVPYQTVGMFLAAILAISGVATLLLLPALIRVMEKRLFKRSDSVLPTGCNCGLCLVASITAAVLLAMNLHAGFGWGTITWISVAAIPVLALICGRMSRREKCRLSAQQDTDGLQENDHESK